VNSKWIASLIERAREKNKKLSLLYIPHLPFTIYLKGLAFENPIHLLITNQKTAFR